MTHDFPVTDAAATAPDDEFGEDDMPVEPVPQPIGYDEFGMRFMDLVLHRDRVMESINRVLGEEFQLGFHGQGFVIVQPSENMRFGGAQDAGQQVQQQSPLGGLGNLLR